MRECRGCHLTLIGSGPLMDAYQRTVRDHHLTAAVDLKGELPREQVWDYLTAADAFVLPSLHEGLSVAMVEALSAGLPVIATTVGGALDHVREGVNGLLVPPRDPQALARAIRSLRDDPERRRRMGAAARATYESMFSKDKAAQALETLLAGLRR